MKSLLIAVVLTGAALTNSALAYSPKEQTNSAPAPRPILASVVKPTNLPLQFAGGLINIEFSLDQDGQPRDIKVLSVKDRALKERIVEAFRQWRFETGARDAASEQKRYVLPLEVRPEV